MPPFPPWKKPAPTQQQRQMELDRVAAEDRRRRRQEMQAALDNIAAGRIPAPPPRPPTPPPVVIEEPRVIRGVIEDPVVSVRAQDSQGFVYRVETRRPNIIRRFLRWLFGDEE